MHPRVQKFQMDIFGHLCALQSSCEHSECCQMAHCPYFSHFARPPSSETQFPITKHDPRLVPKSPSFDARRAKRTIGADLHASPMCPKSLSRDVRRSKCVFYMFKRALAWRPSIKLHCWYIRIRSQALFPLYSQVAQIRWFQSFVFSFNVRVHRTMNS